VAKRSIEGYRPTGIGLGDDPPPDVAALINAAGPLPDRTFEAWRWGPPDEGSYANVTAREYLIECVQSAVREYGWNKQQAHRPTPTQLHAEYDAIHKAAWALLCALHHDVEKMPLALRDGELGTAAVASAPGSGLVSRDNLLRAALSGVKNFHQWSEVARKQVAAAMVLEGRSSPTRRPSRNKGDEALNVFVRRVMESCWVGIWGLEVTDSPRTWAFARAVAKLVGLSMSEDSARARVRSVYADTFEAKARWRMVESDPTTF
jgi:hypothetical protein